MHVLRMRHPFRCSGSRRHYRRSELRICMGILDVWSGSPKVRQRDLVQMGPLKVGPCPMRRMHASCTS